MTKQVNKTSIQVKNFGPIIDATVELRPLTVFVGPSNTGKSYLSILIYALHKAFARAPLHWLDHVHGEYSEPFDQGSHISLQDKDVDDILDFVQSLFGDLDFPEKKYITLPPSIVSRLHPHTNWLGNLMSDEIVRCFGMSEIRELIRKGEKSAQFILRNNLSNHGDYAEHQFKLKKKPKLYVTIPAKVQIPISNGNSETWIRPVVRKFRSSQLWEEARNDDPKQRRSAAMAFLSSVYYTVLPSSIGSMRSLAHYLPADRTGIMHAHSVVVSSLIANAPSAGLRHPKQTPIMSGVLADFLEKLIYIDRLRMRNSKRETGSYISAAIENSILGGSVSVDRSEYTGYPTFGYRPNGWKHNISIGHASSMVSELSPLVLYLRHLVTPNNVLIVEEPESHLHPAMQVALMRQLAAIVKAGIRVIVTTHSEWLLEELANIVQRYKLPESVRSDKIALHPNEVGTWLFESRQRSKGSTVKEINLQDTGLYPSGFDEVSSALHNEWCNISENIEDDS